MTRQHRKPVGPVGLILAVALAGPIMLAPGCRKPSASIPPVHARLGLALQPTSALAMIAADNGYFREQNLDLEIKPYISGRRAMAALLCGDVDAVTTAEVPIVFSSFESSEFRIVASIASAAGQHSIVARRDAGIAQAGDLKGKRIGTQRASAVHFFLHLFLLQHQIDADEVTIEFMKGELLPEALATGRIDAFSMREPYTSEACNLLGDNALVFPDEGLYTRTENLVVSSRMLADHRPAVDGLLRALLEAERFLAAKPDQALAITAKRISVDAATMSRTWKLLDPHVFLDQSLLGSLEQEANWAVESGFTTTKSVPDYLDLIAMEPLTQLRSDLVSIIR